MHTLEQLRNGSLAGITRLQLSCGLTEFPREIFMLADSLEILDLSGNALSALPDDLPRLCRLRVLFCSSNNFTVLPAVLGACPSLTMIGFKSNRIAEVPAGSLPAGLRWLILTDNGIGALPSTIGNCAHLQKLMLAGNQLTSLPPELGACTKLELLRLAANRLDTLPGWLLAMPRLAWLAFAGNPCSAVDGHADAADAPPPIPWTRITPGRQLGEGASGVICQATLASAALPDTEVAVKVFKGAVTSDGLPECELEACMHAGRHPHLIPVLGQVSGHPAGVHGCVMALIDPAFGNLAGPPSLESCTRDVYRADARYTREFVLRLARGIAAAAAHLHARGILHGDLYGHNILCTHRGEVLLGDFGAATRLQAHAAMSEGLQQLEVRAFGVLLGELIARCDQDLPDLARLRNDCTGGHPGQRPLFDAIALRLGSAAAGAT